MTSRVHKWAVGILIALLVLFTLQNLGGVRLRFLFWTFTTSKFVLIALTLALGIALGWLAKTLHLGPHLGAKRSEPAEPLD